MSQFLGGGSSDPSAAPSGDGTGGSDLGTILSSMGQAFAGGGVGPSSPTATVDAVQQATDPTGSIGAQTAITGGQSPPQQTQTQNPQGPNQSGQGGNQNQFAPPSAVEQLKRALQGLTQQQRQNPYGFPANSPQSNADAGQNSPMLNRAARIPPASANPADLPSTNAQETEFMNDNNAPPQSPAGIDPADAVRAGLRSNAPDTSGQFQVPPAANENAPPANDFSTYLNNLRKSGGFASPPPPLDLGTQADQGGLGGLAALARMLGLGPAATGAAIAMKPTPAETGELPQQTLGRSPSGPAPTPETPPALGGGPGNEEEAPTGTPVTKAPLTGKKVETVDPKTKKPVDPKTGDPLPTKPPTKKGPQETPTGYDQNVGPIMRDMSGVSTGVPQGLGELAQMAMPLLMMALGGMGGRGRHGGFRGGGFHPGGRGMWPYHHPTFGWGMHGFHPGGGWRPMAPVHFRQMSGGGGGMNPQMISSLLGGQQGGDNPQAPQGGGPDLTQTGGDQQFGGDAVRPAPPATMTQAKDDIAYLQSLGLPQAGAAALLGNGWQESGLNPTGPAGDSGQSRGMFQWDPNRYAAMQMWARDQGLNPNDRKTQLGYAVHEIQQYYPNLWRQLQQGGNVGQLTQAIFSIFERGNPSKANMANRTSFAQSMAGGGAEVAGKTSTGGSKAPNPQGNPADVDTTPATTQMGPESVGAS